MARFFLKCETINISGSVGQTTQSPPLSQPLNTKQPPTLQKPSSCVPTEVFFQKQAAVGNCRSLLQGDSRLSQNPNHSTASLIRQTFIRPLHRAKRQVRCWGSSGGRVATVKATAIVRPAGKTGTRERRFRVAQVPGSAQALTRCVLSEWMNSLLPQVGAGGLLSAQCQCRNKTNRRSQQSRKKGPTKNEGDYRAYPRVINAMENNTVAEDRTRQ